MNENTLFENNDTKSEIFITPPSDGVSFFMPSRQNRNTAPKRNSTIDMILIPTIIICITLVLSILLKLNAAPETKNTKIQKLKLLKK